MHTHAPIVTHIPLISQHAFKYVCMPHTLAESQSTCAKDGSVVFSLWFFHRHSIHSCNLTKEKIERCDYLYMLGE